jgi:hypothetical protein
LGSIKSAILAFSAGDFQLKSVSALLFGPSYESIYKAGETIFVRL